MACLNMHLRRPSFFLFNGEMGMGLKTHFGFLCSQVVPFSSPSCSQQCHTLYYISTQKFSLVSYVVRWKERSHNLLFWNCPDSIMCLLFSGGRPIKEAHHHKKENIYSLCAHPSPPPRPKLIITINVQVSTLMEEVFSLPKIRSQTHWNGPMSDVHPTINYLTPWMDSALIKSFSNLLNCWKNNAKIYWKCQKSILVKLC